MQKKFIFLLLGAAFCATLVFVLLPSSANAQATSITNFTVGDQSGSITIDPSNYQVRGTLLDGTGNPITGQTLRLQRNTGSQGWQGVGPSGSTDGPPLGTATMSWGVGTGDGGEYRLRFDGFGSLQPSNSASINVTVSGGGGGNCSGSFTNFILNPSTADPGQQVMAGAVGVSNCQGETILFTAGSLTGAPLGSCAMSATGTGQGCNTFITAPDSTVTIFAQVQGSSPLISISGQLTITGGGGVCTDTDGGTNDPNSPATCTDRNGNVFADSCTLAGPPGTINEFECNASGNCVAVTTNCAAANQCTAGADACSGAGGLDVTNLAPNQATAGTPETFMADLNVSGQQSLGGGAEVTDCELLVNGTRVDTMIISGSGQVAGGCSLRAGGVCTIEREHTFAATDPASSLVVAQCTRITGEVDSDSATVQVTGTGGCNNNNTCDTGETPSSCPGDCTCGVSTPGNSCVPSGSCSGTTIANQTCSSGNECCDVPAGGSCAALGEDCGGSNPTCCSPNNCGASGKCVAPASANCEQDPSICAADEFCRFGTCAPRRLFSDLPVANVNFENPLDADSLGDLINNIIDFIFTIALIVAPILLVIAGVIFMTALGDPGRVATARRMLLWTVIGFGIIIISKGLVEVLRAVLGV